MPSADRIRQARLRAGDHVEVRSREEILATLDSRGMLDNQPFMPEMLEFCGRRFVVDKVSHKTCDTIHRTGIRRMDSTVHLQDLRCDGSAHGGCQAGCLLYWKEAWLKPVGARTGQSPLAGDAAPAGASSQFDLAALQRATMQDPGHDGEIRYRCQVTEVLRASRPCAWWNPYQYVLDVVSGNWTLRHVVRVLSLAALRRIIPLGVGYRVLIALYDRLARRFGMHPYREVENQWGPIPKGSPTPESTLALQAGDWIQVRPRAEILATLNTSARNRGIHFDPEMVEYCGGKFQVRAVVRRLIEEGTGRMLEMKNPCIALEGAVCKSEYSDRRYLCPRAIIPYWRPVWLEKVAPGSDEPGSGVPR